MKTQTISDDVAEFYTEDDAPLTFRRLLLRKVTGSVLTDKEKLRGSELACIARKDARLREEKTASFSSGSTIFTLTFDAAATHFAIAELRKKNFC